MKAPLFDRQRLIRWLAAILGAALLILVLVLIPLKTHREPVPIEPSGRRSSETDALPVFSHAPDVLPSAAPFSPGDDAELATLLEEFAGRQAGTWDLCVIDMSHGAVASYSQTDKPMISASLIKLYIMGALFERFEDGSLSYNANRQQLREMIIRSDSAAANRMILALGDGDEEAGIAAVNAFISSIGCTDTRLNRKMLAEEGDENTTTAADCAQFFKQLYRFDLVSPHASSEMLDLLKDQRINDRIPVGLPEGTVCAHKTGELVEHCCADAGLIFSPNADYILCAICNDPPEDGPAMEAIGELSGLVYAYFNPDSLLAETTPPEDN